jgi:hypothetical protein
MVAPAVAAPLVIGLDVGGTKILSGLGAETSLLGMGLVGVDAPDGFR